MRFALPLVIALSMPVGVGISACGSSDWTPTSLRDPTSVGTAAALGSSGPGNPPAGTIPPSASTTPGAEFVRGVSVVLEPAGPSELVAFAVPFARGAVRSEGDLALTNEAGAPIANVRMRPLLFDFAPDGSRRGVRSMWIEVPHASFAQLPARVMLHFAHSGARRPQSAAAPPRPYAQSAHAVRVTVPTATYGVESRGASSYAAVPRAQTETVLFEGMEPNTIASFPPGYLAQTGIFGDLVPRAVVQTRSDLANIRFLSDAFVQFADGAMGATGYPLAPGALALETEAWLYDRCATYLLAYAHAGEARHLKHGLATCAKYARTIGREGEMRGIFTGKEGRDTKYSHARGLYAYYALTGDEAALEAGRAIADMWEQDPLFVVPYRNGATRGVDKLWTERLLAASIEGGVYGYLLTGEARYLASARGLVKTALRHITTDDAAELHAITKTSFPPQSCFVHNALQQAEGNADVPWCSSWMSELVLDPLLRYEEVTGDMGVEEIFVRLARSMRDAGTTYFKDNPVGDSFLAPSIPGGGSSGGESPRVLVPLYGYGIADAKRVPSGEWSDFEHCPDASAITALALRALKRTGHYADRPIPASPALRVDLSRFASEGESILALHRELSFCAAQTLEGARRERRDPRTASQDVLARAFAAGDAAAQARELSSNKIGWPVYATNPGRKLSWWFNTSIAQIAWLSEAKITPPPVR